MNDGGDPVLKALVKALAAKSLRAVTLFVGDERYAAETPLEASSVGADEAAVKARRHVSAEACYAETQAPGPTPVQPGMWGYSESKKRIDAAMAQIIAHEPKGIGRYDDITGPGENGPEGAALLAQDVPEAVELFELTPQLRQAIIDLRHLQREGHNGSCMCRPCCTARAPLVQAECLDLVYTADPV